MTSPSPSSGAVAPVLGAAVALALFGALLLTAPAAPSQLPIADSSTISAPAAVNIAPRVPVAVRGRRVERSATQLAATTPGPALQSAPTASSPLTLQAIVLAAFAACAGWVLGWYASQRTATPPEQLALVATAGARPRNILIFGPNGSGKGTQGALIAQQYAGMAHIESGAIFRQQISSGSALGKLAKGYIDRGELVPDEVTIPMVLDTMKARGGQGWLLDGFPRNVVQAEKLWEALQAEGLPLDFVVEILLPRPIAKARIMGRRLCATDPNHPNNIGIPAIAPAGDVCRVCGGALSSRADDQDEGAIDKRHDIYYNTADGTLGAVEFYRKLGQAGKVKFLQLDGTGSIAAVKENLLAGLKDL